VQYCIEAVADSFGERARDGATDWTQVTESLGAARVADERGRARYKPSVCVPVV
jgi:hypothetical protein